MFSKSSNTRQLRVPTEPLVPGHSPARASDGRERSVLSESDRETGAGCSVLSSLGRGVARRITLFVEITKPLFITGNQSVNSTTTSETTSRLER